MKLKENDVIKQSLKEKTGATIKLWLDNNFFYQGVLLECDGKRIRLEDRKKGYMIIPLHRIDMMEQVV